MRIMTPIAVAAAVDVVDDGYAHGEDYDYNTVYVSNLCMYVYMYAVCLCMFGCVSAPNHVGNVRACGFECPNCSVYVVYVCFCVCIIV